MGEEEEVVANGTTTTEEKGEDVSQKKEVETDGMKEMEEDDKEGEKVETQEMDVEQEGKESQETKEEIEEENGCKEEEEEEDNKEEAGSEAMETKETEENEEKVEEKGDKLKEEEEMAEKSKQGKRSKRSGKGKTSGVKVKSGKKEVEVKKEQKTPVSSVIDRPVRERKSVERLVASIEKEPVKEFHIEKGRGTALKDIPNVAYKLSKRKVDETLKLLHTILFGRRGKAVQVKINISRFSGFVWNENEEKQKIKIKEKFDKCVKEKLLEFNDVLDMPVAKANTRKEDIVAKLMDFLEAPHATTSELLAEKEQSSKGKKRKRVVKGSTSMSGSTPSKRSAKSQIRIESASKGKVKKNAPETEDKLGGEEEEEEHEEEETVNGVPEKSKYEVPQHSESEENKDGFEDESEEDTGKARLGSKKSSAKEESAGKANTKKVATPKKSSPPSKRTPVKSSSNRSKVPVKSSSNRSKVDDSSDTTPKTFSRKKRTEVIREKSSTPRKHSSMEKTGKKVVKGKDKPKEKLRPSDDDLRNAICAILKEVDFNTATFTDILKQLAGRFNTDLIPRKSSIKIMIQDELTKLADEGDDDEDDDDDAGRDEAQPSSQGLEA